MNTFITRFNKIREQTLKICISLEKEDYVVQPMPNTSPIKWHLGHTTWFFETVLLKAFMPDYKEFNKDFAFIFNSYYEGLGKRVNRSERGSLSRPTVEDILAYRAYVDMEMEGLLSAQYLKSERNVRIAELLEIGIQHEQQHQELILMDIKYILGHNPLFPAYDPVEPGLFYKTQPILFVDFMEELVSVGTNNGAFHYDNETPKHLTYIPHFEIANRPVSNEEFLYFMEDGGYRKPQFWHMDGWEWVKKNQINSPLYWQKHNNQWYEYTMHGVHLLDLNDFVNHISWYEAAAFAKWKGCRLPTEQEWEIAAKSGKISDIGRRWEWTGSAYLPYPGYKPYEGPLSEYNGKFMINQMVLRGHSTITPEDHSRLTYRNFFKPEDRWQFAGVRLAKDH